MKKCINVLFVAGKIGISNGAYHSLLTTVKRLKDMGVNPLILLSRHGVVEDQLIENGLHCEILPYQSCTIPADAPSKIKGFTKTVINNILEPKVGKIIDQNNIDIVHINVGTTSIGAKSAISRGIPLIWHLREFLEDDVNLTYINKNKTQFLLNQANCLIAISDSIAAHYKMEYKVSKVKTIYNGIEFKYTTPVKKIKTNTNILLSLVGRIVESKGQMEAVKAVKILRDKGHTNIQLNIIGSIEDLKYYRKIKEYIDKNNLVTEINFIEYTSDLSEIWEKTDIALVCSTREGFGRVTAEFMLNGVPVVGSDTGATPELLANNRGFLYKYGSVESLTEAIEKAFLNPENTYFIAKNAQEYAKIRFTSSYCANEIFKIYKKLLKV